MPQLLKLSYCSKIISHFKTLQALVITMTWALTTPLEPASNPRGNEAYSLSTTSSLQAYLELLHTYTSTLGPEGNYRDGEIQVILDPSEIARVEQMFKDRMIQSGMSETAAHAASRVGIISEDKFWYFLRDAVIFPNGSKGLYNRIIPRSALTGASGVVIAPLLPDGRLALILTFRHATRSWELELPRGGRNSDETVEQAAFRETLEETGYRLQRPTLLGWLNLDSGIAASKVAVILGFAIEKRSSQYDESEAIKGVVALTKAQVKEAYQNGFIEMTLNGQTRKLSVKDPCVAYVLLIAEQKGLW